MTREEFVRLMTTDLPEAPAYFSMDARINREGAPALEDLSTPPALSPEEVNKLAQSGALVLDVRPGPEFGNGHVPRSVNIGLGGQFASWVGSLVSPDDRVIIVAEGVEQVSEAVTRMARVGLENVVGYLDGGVAAWEGAGLDYATLPQMPVGELRAQIDERREGLQIVDVRRPSEYEAGHIPGAVNVPLAELEKGLGGLDPRKPTAVACAGGYRSSAASSLLERKGFLDLYNVIGGTGAWTNAGYEAETTQGGGR
jgi:hydroxyacylglutathione hydrolase